MEDDNFKTVAEFSRSMDGKTRGFRIQIFGFTDLNQDEQYRITCVAENLERELFHSQLIRDESAIERGNAVERELRRCFEAPIYYKRIPNEYWNNGSPFAVSSPWLLVTTSVGLFKIGWRKRVICIDWRDSDVSATAENLFPKEDVTKSGCLIHAWTYDKAREYITTILRSATPGSL
jgi:hypothetical protein